MKAMDEHATKNHNVATQLVGQTATPGVCTMDTLTWIANQQDLHVQGMPAWAGAAMAV